MTPFEYRSPYREVLHCKMYYHLINFDYTENEMTAFSQYHNATAKRAPKNREFFIFSITKDGGLCSMAQLPGIHTDLIKARAEAQRLAVVSPEKKFGVAEVRGVAVVNGVTWE